MRWLVVLALVGCGKDAAKPAAHEDRHEPQVAPSKLTLAVTIGGAKATWTDATFASVPKIAGAASDGEARDTWSLRALVAAQVGAGARVTGVTGPAGTATIDADAWNDPSRIPILHTTRRGTLKFRWAEASGAWGDTVVRDVTGLEIAK